MTLRSVGTLLAVSVFALAAPASAGAGELSRNNPYRSFNISGINYGAEQWEREHRQAAPQPRSNSSWPRRGVIFRRR
ncbi:hypothetical protein [Planctomyces sp. SH-PL14]|uniref:hypothetical protein n=1 Tax=Planctomyces sp. SH-PL14 TaxID=1632864 RepID=UPI00078D1FB3|nr:hypothetical protein [Planctomyces sp. SH-PL14]AMV17875.1 hypothetical protein VT03_08275 [Planctomyces sp. SH-PL14]